MLDTVNLLKECDAGTKMAVASIDEVLDKVTDDALKGLLQESKNHHKELECEIVEQLKQHNAQEKEPNGKRNVMDENKCKNGNGQQR